ncbi:MAG: hypothetical protein ACFE0O_00330 [Opitutales bacterium]
MSAESSTPPSGEDDPEPIPPETYQAEGPFVLPVRDWLLAGLLILLFLGKALLGIAQEARPLPLLVAGAMSLAVLPYAAARIGYRVAGGRPHYAELAFIGTAGVVFIGFSVALYALALGAADSAGG